MKPLLDSYIDNQMWTSTEKQTTLDNDYEGHPSSTSTTADNQASLLWLDNLAFSALADPFHSDWPYW